MKKLKVVIMCSYPDFLLAESLGLDKSVIKRVTTWNYALIDELSRISDIDLHVITGTNLCNEITYLETPNFNITFVPIKKWPNILTFYRYTKNVVLKIIDKIDPDIVHGIGTEHVWPFIAISSKRPALITVHGILSEIIKRDKPAIISKMRIFGYLEKSVLKNTQYMISINPYAEKIVRPLTQAKMFNVENPVQKQYYNIENNSTNKHILFVGGIERLKGIHVLLEAFNNMNNEGTCNTKLIIAGPDRSASFSAQLKEKYKQLIDDGLVEFRGFIQTEELATLYRDAAFLVLPSFQETAPMCIAEAMATGTPVIATNVGGISHMIDADTGIVVEPDDAQALEVAMTKLINDEELLSKMKTATKTVAIERWSAPKIASKTVDVYKIIIKI